MIWVWLSRETVENYRESKKIYLKDNKLYWQFFLFIYIPEYAKDWLCDGRPPACCLVHVVSNPLPESLHCSALWYLSTVSGEVFLIPFNGEWGSLSDTFQWWVGKSFWYLSILSGGVFLIPFNGEWDSLSDTFQQWVWKKESLGKTIWPSAGRSCTIRFLG